MSTRGRYPGDHPPSRIEPRMIEAAVQASPEAFLRARYGKDVFLSSNRRSIRVKSVLRTDRGTDGRWIACDWYGGGIGDNVALVRWATGCGFVAAVEQLTGVAVTQPMPPLPATPRILRPRLPSNRCIPEGRRYLEARGISQATVSAAEAAGAVSYCAGAVLFLGRDHAHPSREVRLAALRLFLPRVGPDGEPFNKRDLAGSDKAFPMLLPGDPGLVVVVEGGVNALAARDLYAARAGAAPTIIATGGVGIRNWLETNLPLRQIVSGADHVILLGENEVGSCGEPDPEKQLRTDELRSRLADAVARAREGALPDLVYPPPGVKDAADWSLRSGFADNAPPEEDQSTPCPAMR